MNELMFEPETHTYRVNGRVVPSVTQVISAAGLSEYSMVPRDKLEYACRFGTAVHYGAELADKGILDEQSTEQIVLDRVGYWKNFLQVAEEKGWTDGHCFIESRFYSHDAYDFAGTIDRAYVNGKTAVIIDLKTGSKYAAAAIQTAAYEHLFRAQYNDLRKVKRMAVYLRDDGFEIEEHKDDTDIHIFRAALNLYKWKQQKGVSCKPQN